MSQIPASLLANSRMKLNIVELAERDTGTDFKKAVLKALVAVNWDVLHSEVLVAGYVKPRKTPGGIIIPEKSVDEDRWQSKVGLVIKLGDTAFKFGPFNGTNYDYTGKVPQIGQYVTYHSSDSRETSYRGVSLRWIPDQLIKAVIPDADVDLIY